MDQKKTQGFRYSAFFALTFAFIAFAACAASASPRSPAVVDFAPAFGDGVAADSAVIDFARAFGDDAEADRAAVEALQEEEGQDFGSLFDGTESDSGVVIAMEGSMEIDTAFAWNNNRINSGRFDYKTLGPGDTIKIPLIDSAQGKFYVSLMDSENRVTSRFGMRRYMWHYGTDVKLARGDTLRSAFDGIVRVIQFERRGYGNVAVVRHHSGLETLYGHMDRVLVKANQLVKAGEAIGLGGNTGRSTGAHLHFEIRYYGEPFNPEYIIDFSQNYALRSDTLVLTRDNFEYLTEVRKTVYHVVRRGDNLGSIARRYGTTVNNLCRLNGITPRTPLSIGRRLVVRSGKEAEKQVVSTAAPAASAAVSPENVPAPADDANIDEALNTGGPETVEE